MGKVVLSACLTLYYTVCVIGAGKCPPGQYRDHESGLCYPCSDICRSGQKGELCRIYCPDYDRLNPKGEARTLDLAVLSQCPPDQYYDVNVNKCDYCSSICEYHEIQHTTKECMKHCPQELGINKMGLKAGVVHTDSVQTSTTTVVISSIGVILVAVTLLATMLFLRRRFRLTETQLPPLHPQPEDVPLYPSSIQCSEQSAIESAESFTADEQTSVKTPVLAFLDLPMVDRDMTESDL